MIVLRHVWMHYPVARRYWDFLFHPFAKRKTFAALSDMNLTIHPGDRIALLGPNGAGKTTLLKLIGGLLLPSEGELLVNGLDTVWHNAEARRSVGFVMNEERSFYWRLTGRQNLEFYGALDNLFGRLLKSRIDELLSMVGLNDAADKLVATYSSGMKQRLAMARGLLADPDVLILDEPTRTLDPIACEELIDFIVERLHRDAGKTLLIATHRLEEASKLCRRVLVIDKGRVRAESAIESVAAQGLTLAAYYRKAIGHDLDHDVSPEIVGLRSA